MKHAMRMLLVRVMGKQTIEGPPPPPPPPLPPPPPQIGTNLKTNKQTSLTTHHRPWLARLSKIHHNSQRGLSDHLDQSAPRGHTTQQAVQERPASRDSKAAIVVEGNHNQIDTLQRRKSRHLNSSRRDDDEETSIESYSATADTFQYKGTPRGIQRDSLSVDSAIAPPPPSSSVETIQIRYRSAQLSSFSSPSPHERLAIHHILQKSMRSWRNRIRTLKSMQSSVTMISIGHYTRLRLIMGMKALKKYVSLSIRPHYGLKGLDHSSHRTVSYSSAPSAAVHTVTSPIQSSREFVIPRDLATWRSFVLRKQAQLMQVQWIDEQWYVGKMRHALSLWTRHCRRRRRGKRGLNHKNNNNHMKKNNSHIISHSSRAQHLTPTPLSSIINRDTFNSIRTSTLPITGASVIPNEKSIRLTPCTLRDLYNNKYSKNHPNPLISSSPITPYSVVRELNHSEKTSGSVSAAVSVSAADGYVSEDSILSMGNDDDDDDSSTVIDVDLYPSDRTGSSIITMRKNLTQVDQAVTLLIANRLQSYCFHQWRHQCLAIRHQRRVLIQRGFRNYFLFCTRRVIGSRLLYFGDNIHRAMSLAKGLRSFIAYRENRRGKRKEREMRKYSEQSRDRNGDRVGSAGSTRERGRDTDGLWEGSGGVKKGGIASRPPLYPSLPPPPPPPPLPPPLIVEPQKRRQQSI
jgi:hypothetical protein